MDSTDLVDTFDRTALLLVLSRGASDAKEARRMLEMLRLHIRIEPSVLESRQAQIVALTSVVAATRTFLGGVTVECPEGVEPLLRWPGSQSFSAILEAIGARLGRGSRDVPTIGIGQVTAELYPYVLGSIAGVSRDSATSAFTGAFAPSAIYAGAIAVGEIFQRRLYEIAGIGDARGAHRELNFDLCFKTEDARVFDYGALRLPGELWLIGAGNIGQALLFGLSLLPYADPSSVNLVIQDIDHVNVANLTTSVLTSASAIGLNKTRVAAAYLKERAFCPRIIEQRFGPWTGRSNVDPSLAVCGVDNYLARRALEMPGFTSILDIGLGGQPTDYTGYRITTFPGPRSAKAWFSGSAQPRILDPEIALRLGDERDSCGSVTLATTTAVGTPYVSIAATAIGLAQLISRVNTGAWLEVIDHDVHTTSAPSNIAFSCSSDPPVHQTAAASPPPVPRPT